MIIRSHRLKEGTEFEEKNGKVLMTKTENIEPVLKANYEDRKDLNNGFSKERNIRRIARVPFSTWLEWTRANPELLAGDRKLREKTLKKLLYTEEGKMFWTVNKGV